MALFRRKDATGTTVEEPTHLDGQGATEVQAGVPGRCRLCDGFGYIDRIDMVNRFQTQHCLDCGHTWEFSFDEDGAVIDLTDPDPADDVIDLTDAPLAARDADQLRG